MTTRKDRRLPPPASPPLPLAPIGPRIVIAKNAGMSPERRLYGVESDRLKTCALIEKRTPVWPSIRQDLNEASRNGLNAQGAHPARGFWLESVALQWALERGKLTNPAQWPAWLLR